jgi:hypothetical protein
MRDTCSPAEFDENIFWKIDPKPPKTSTYHGFPVTTGISWLADESLPST